jgi:hypothetical protein
MGKMSNAATYAAAGGAWSTIAGSSTTKWRVKKSSGGQAVGWGEVNPGVSSGLVSASGLKGATAGATIATGYVGEILTNAGTLASITTAQYNDRGTITLTAGVWDITGTAGIDPAASTVVTEIRMGISSTSGNSATGLVAYENTLYNYFPAGFVPGGNIIYSLPVWRVNISSTTTYYVKIMAAFSTSTCSADGFIRATRIA